MPAFEIHIASDLTTTSTFHVVLVKDIERARELAEAVLRDSPAATRVEVRQASKLLFAIGEQAAKRPSRPPARPPGLDSR